MKKRRFTRQSEIKAPVETVFAWHEEPGAVDKLTPPWEKVEVLERPANLKPGTRVKFRVFTGPISQVWLAEHREYDPPYEFADTQLSGPFAFWYHRHRFEPTASGTTLMTDDIEYALPFGWLGDMLGGGFVRSKLKKMFDYRHKVVKTSLESEQRRVN